jgi:hypothetical protein
VTTELERAICLLPALASSDLSAVAELTAEHVVLFGTEAHERWESRAALLEALDQMRPLGLRAEWATDLVARHGWVAGTAIYTFPDGRTLATRVSFVFDQGLLVHGHFSVAQGE